MRALAARCSTSMRGDVIISSLQPDLPEPVSKRERPGRALLLANPNARSVHQQLHTAIEALEQLGVELLREPRLKPQAFPDLIRHYRDDVNLVIIGGGDGTLNAVADALVETGLTLGLLPLGTANDLARTLQIPTDVEAAARVIAANNTRLIDLGCVNGKYFFNVASLGLSVRVTRQLDRHVKSRWGPLAYLITAAKVLWKARPFRAEIVAGGATWHTRTIQITIGNGRYYGGGMAVAEDAAIDDQRLDLFSLEVDHWWQLLPLMYALRTGSMKDVSYVRTLSDREFEIRTRRPRSISTDGEITTETPAVFRIVPAALRVCVPPASQS